jgi:hypothetical protein
MDVQRRLSYRTFASQRGQGNGDEGLTTIIATQVQD